MEPLWHFLGLKSHLIVSHKNRINARSYMAPLESKSPFITGKKIGRNDRDFRQILREKNRLLEGGRLEHLWQILRSKSRIKFTIENRPKNIFDTFWDQNQTWLSVEELDKILNMIVGLWEKTFDRKNLNKYPNVLVFWSKLQ